MTPLDAECPVVNAECPVDATENVAENAEYLVVATDIEIENDADTVNMMDVLNLVVNSVVEGAVV